MNRDETTRVLSATFGEASVRETTRSMRGLNNNGDTVGSVGNHIFLYNVHSKAFDIIEFSNRAFLSSQPMDLNDSGQILSRFGERLFSATLGAEPVSEPASLTLLAAGLLALACRFAGKRRPQGGLSSGPKVIVEALWIVTPLSC